MPELRELALDLCACVRSADPRSVTQALLACPGVERAHVDAYLTWALATFDPTRTSADAVVEQLAAAGLVVSVTRLFDPEPPIPSRSATPSLDQPRTPEPVQEPR